MLVGWPPNPGRVSHCGVWQACWHRRALIQCHQRQRVTLAKWRSDSPRHPELFRDCSGLCSAAAGSSRALFGQVGSLYHSYYPYLRPFTSSSKLCAITREFCRQVCVALRTRKRVLITEISELTVSIRARQHDLCTILKDNGERRSAGVPPGVKA